MERESFEDAEVAEILNKHFVAIKVDREERPDIDHIYMTVCQALTGSGGWPLSVFLSPDRIPFYAGTYFPKQNRMGMPGLISLLGKINEAWKNNRDVLLESGSQIVDSIKQEHLAGDAGELSDDSVYDAFAQFRDAFDDSHGGFGHAPKFPTPHNLYFLLRYWHSTGDASALEMVEKTLDSMYRGGIYDHIGFGFSRYSTDRKWLVPHFEKMLYDNALLAMAYLETYQATRNERYANVARQILTYVMRDMTSAEGGFYSAEDADSEGTEGKFYVWSPDEVEQVLGEADGRLYAKLFGIAAKGNFEGKSIPNLINSGYSHKQKEFVEQCRKKLFAYREKRVHPYKDDKILTGWNDLMIAALAMGGRILGNSEYTSAAEKAFHFVTSRLVRSDNRLMARYRDGDAAYLAYVDDYSFIVWGLIELYEATFQPEYLQKALNFNDDMIKLFWDEEKGGLFVYGSDGEELIVRPKEVYDGATPSGNSVSALNFLRLARLTGRNDLEDKARQLFEAFGSMVSGYPRGYSFFMTAFMFSKAAAKEIVVVGNEENANAIGLLDVVKERFDPFSVSLFYSKENESIKSIVPFLENYTTVNGQPAAYVCKNYSCSSPVTDKSRLKEILQ